MHLAFTNLALSASYLATQHMNKIFAIERGFIKNSAC
jgi:hypothetical protein